MAVAQGICKNCGSLIVYNTADEVCECIFCNAVFPLAELIPMDAELKDIVFPNEKFEKTDATKHHYVVPVLPDQVEVNVEREKRSKTLDASTKEKIEYEVQAKDVKAPKNVIIALTAISVAVLVIVLAISLPMYNSRTKLLDKMQGNMATITKDIVTVDTSLDDKGFSKGYFISGIKCSNVAVVTNDEIDEATAKSLFVSYCNKRAEVSNIKGDSDVEITIYAQKGIYKVTADSFEFTENSLPIEDKK